MSAGQRAAQGLASVLLGQAVIIGVAALLFWRLDLPTRLVAAGYVGLTAASLVYLAARPARAAVVGALVVGLVAGLLVYSPRAQSVAESGLVTGGSGAKAGIERAAGWVRERLG